MKIEIKDQEEAISKIEAREALRKDNKERYLFIEDVVYGCLLLVIVVVGVMYCLSVF